MLSCAAVRSCLSYSSFRLWQPDTNVNLTLTVTTDVTAVSNVNITTSRRCFHCLWHVCLTDAIKNISDLQPDCCHTRFPVVACPACVIQGHPFLLGLNVKLHTDQETLMISSNIEWANGPRLLLWQWSLDGYPAHRCWQEHFLNTIS